MSVEPNVPLRTPSNVRSSLLALLSGAIGAGVAFATAAVSAETRTIHIEQALNHRFCEVDSSADRGHRAKC
jgi:hypothetical protein